MGLSAKEVPPKFFIYGGDMEKLVHQIRLQNFNLDCEYDRDLFELCRKIFPGPDRLIQTCKQELHNLTTKQSRCDGSFSELERLPPEDIRYWVKRLLDEKIVFGEAFALLTALDVKMSLLAMHTGEPHPGCFQKRGVSACDPFRNPAPAEHQKPNLRLVKR